MSSPPSYFPRSPLTPHLSTADFETSSIRSAAPSYISDAPTYHSTLPSSPFSSSSTSSLGSPLSPFSSRGSSAHSLNPSLSDFRIPTWSTTRCNPTARHYHSVAHRRATIANIKEEQAMLAAASSANPVAAVVRMAEEREREEFGSDTEDGGSAGKRLRPLEDPDLVGLEAAERNRRERVGRMGNEVLIREDKRWDWLISQMKDWDEREKSWNKFRTEVEQGKRSKLASRLGMRKGGRV